MPELLKENYIQEVIGTSVTYKKYACECYVWYFMHHECWLQRYIYVVNPSVVVVIKGLFLCAFVMLLINKCFRICEKVMIIYVEKTKSK